MKSDLIAAATMQKCVCAFPKPCARAVTAPVTATPPNDDYRMICCAVGHRGTFALEDLPEEKHAETPMRCAPSPLCAPLPPPHRSRTRSAGVDSGSRASREVTVPRGTRVFQINGEMPLVAQDHVFWTRCVPLKCDRVFVCDCVTVCLWLLCVWLHV